MINVGILSPLNITPTEFINLGPMRYVHWISIYRNDDMFQFIGKDMKSRGRDDATLRRISNGYYQTIISSLIPGVRVIISGKKITITNFTSLDDAKTYISNWIKNDNPTEGDKITLNMNGVMFGTTMFGFAIVNGVAKFDYLDEGINQMRINLGYYQGFIVHHPGCEIMAVPDTP
jgi:hypothetical protein